jgi:3-isopropylmalate/(R)-2-methylmalate dehydratase small subunit
MGDLIHVDYAAGVITNKTTGESYPCDKIPEHIMAIADCGGLIEYIKAKRI